ncbi:hypothetical protein DBT53_010575, partial [Aerococcus mictus]|uniref:hypothetical protein n=1 Tax=Aerococcus mictus TaxID=2976810 RepID=UPI002FD06027
AGNAAARKGAFKQPRQAGQFCAGQRAAERRSDGACHIDAECRGKNAGDGRAWIDARIDAGLACRTCGRDHLHTGRRDHAPVDNAPIDNADGSGERSRIGGNRSGGRDAERSRRTYGDTARRPGLHQLTSRPISASASAPSKTIGRPS